MQVSSGIKINSSPNEPSCTNVTVSFNGVLLVVTGTWRSPYLSPATIRLQTKPGLVGEREKTSHKTTVVVFTMHSLLQVIRRRQGVAVRGTHLTGLRAYRPMCPKRLYTVCLETIVPVAEES
ncbi:uncharacterized protein TNCV_4951981 [Trichonephila clavipes]|nr:uncharacterized protein TNCV_4951981 [Trichonephila clavipes]